MSQPVLPELIHERSMLRMMSDQMGNQIKWEIGNVTWHCQEGHVPFLFIMVFVRRGFVAPLPPLKVVLMQLMCKPLLSKCYSANITGRAAGRTTGNPTGGGCAGPFLSRPHILAHLLPLGSERLGFSLPSTCFSLQIRSVVSCVVVFDEAS